MGVNFFYLLCTTVCVVKIFTFLIKDCSVNSHCRLEFSKFCNKIDQISYMSSGWKSLQMFRLRSPKGQKGKKKSMVRNSCLNTNQKEFCRYPAYLSSYTHLSHGIFLWHKL